MTTDFGRITDFEPAPVLAVSEVTPIGQFRGVAYGVTGDGRELRIGSFIPPFEFSNRPSPGEVWLEETIVKPNPMSRVAPPIREQSYTRAWEVEPGTYQRLVDADRAANVAQEAKRAKAATVRRHDAAELIGVLDRQPERHLALGVGADDRPDPGEVLDPLAESVSVLSKSPKMLSTPGREPVRGLRAIIGWLHGQGIILAAVGARLDVRARLLSPAVVEVLTAFEDLLVAELIGEPILCALPHPKEAPPAWTVTAGAHVPICESHLMEGLE